MPLPYAFILLRTADLRLDPTDRTVLEFPLLQGGKAPQIVVGRIGHHLGRFAGVGAFL